MDERPAQEALWMRAIIIGALLLIGFAAVWYRLAREGRAPIPARVVVYLALAALAVGPALFLLVRRLARGESEDAAALEGSTAHFPNETAYVGDYSRDYPLVFRPEWRPLAISIGMPVISAAIALLQADTPTVWQKIAALLLTLVVSGLFLGLLLARSLTISWPGVTLRELRKRQFWAWDQIQAIVLWERRGRKQPALRLRTLQGEDELVSLGHIDFADEDRLFDALLSRVGRLELRVEDTTVLQTSGRGDVVRRAWRQMREREAGAAPPQEVRPSRTQSGARARSQAQEPPAQPAESPSPAAGEFREVDQAQRFLPGAFADY